MDDEILKRIARIEVLAVNIYRLTALRLVDDPRDQAELLSAAAAALRDERKLLCDWIAARVADGAAPWNAVTTRTQEAGGASVDTIVYQDRPNRRK